MQILGNGVPSRSRASPHSSVRSFLEQKQIKPCSIGFLKLWAALGGRGRSLSMHRLRRVETSSELFISQVNQSKNMKRLQKSSKRSLWRADLAQEAPFVIAIGACIFSSFILVGEDNEETKRSESPVENSTLGANDIRHGAMTIISFIPLFNWLGWVFAWLDTNEQRYLFYSIVYLAPYLRTGFSLSPDDSWLPVASIIACIVHVQLDVNLNTGAELGNEFLRDAVKQIYPKVRIPKLWGQGKRFTEPLPPKTNENQFPAEEEFRRQELLEFDRKLSSVENLNEENKFKKSGQTETNKKTYNPEKSDD